MADEIGHHILWLWTAPELAALVAVFGLLVSSLVGTPPVFATELASVSMPLRVAGVAFVAIELLIPVWIWIDLGRDQRSGSSLWVHVAAMPLFNLFGLVAYIQERQRINSRSETPEGRTR